MEKRQSVRVKLPSSNTMARRTRVCDGAEATRGIRGPHKRSVAKPPRQPAVFCEGDEVGGAVPGGGGGGGGGALLTSIGPEPTAAGGGGGGGPGNCIGSGGGGPEN